MRRELFLPTPDGTGRLLLLIDAFSGDDRSLEGRTKLAKLDFLLRYPRYLDRALRAVSKKGEADRLKVPRTTDIETEMVRFRYGPWDPAYFAILGSLLGRGLIVPIPETRGIGYRTTERGRSLAARLTEVEEWRVVAARTYLLRKHFDWTGSRLKNFVYTNFPEVTGAEWGDVLAHTY